MKETKGYTRSELFRMMDDEALAKYFSEIDNCPSPKKERSCDNNCYECWLSWFKEEAS